MTQGQLASDPIPTARFQCRHSGITFNRQCPVTRCPANIGRKHESGCAYSLFNRNNLDAYDLSVIYKKTVEEVNERFQNEVGRVQALVNLHERLNVYQPPARQCPNCGVTRGTPGECLNVKKCRNRKTLFGKVFIANEELVRMLQLSWNKFAWLWGQPEQDMQASLITLFQLDDRQLSRLSRLPSIV